MASESAITDTAGSGPTIDDLAAAERREYFRVEDRALLRFQIIEAEAARNQPAESFFDDGELFWLMRELRTIERENHNLLRAIAEQSRDLAQYLRGINRKIDLLASAVLARDPVQGALPQEISLSEGGLSLVVEPRLAVGCTLAFELTLLPEHVGVVGYAEVIANRDEPPQRTVLRFLRLPDADRQLIARHIFQVQVMARRQQEETDDTGF